MKFTSPLKHQSRVKTIIEPFKEAFGKFPHNGQYWTLCARCYDDGLIKESEYAQVTSSLIRPEQFYGVDLDEETIRQNKRIGRGNFLHGDFFSVLSSWPTFNPSVVNLDLLRTFKSEAHNIKRVFLLLNEHKNLLFNFNILLENYRVKPREPQEIIDFLTKDPEIAVRIGDWDIKGVRFYLYRGLGHKTTMLSTTLIKR